MIHGAFRIRKYLRDATVKIITAELSWKCKIAATLIREQKDSLRIEATAQSQLVMYQLSKNFALLLACNSKGILHMLRKTEMTEKSTAHLFFSNGKCWHILSISVMQRESLF